MFIHSIILFLVLFSCATSLRVSRDFFDDNCAALCDQKNENREQTVKEKCAEFYNSELSGSYSVEEIKRMSGCRNAFVHLIDDNGNEYTVKKDIGVCYLSSGDVGDKCITTGKNPGKMIIWKREKRFVAEVLAISDGRIDVCVPDRVQGRSNSNSRSAPANDSCCTIS